MAQSNPNANQIYDSSNGKLVPATTPNPPSVQYGAQGMRGRLLRLQTPRLPGPSLGQSAVQAAFRRPK